MYLPRDTQCNETQKKPFARIVDFVGHVMDQLSTFDENDKVLIGESPLYIPSGVYKYSITRKTNYFYFFLNCVRARGLEALGRKTFPGFLV